MTTHQLAAFLDRFAAGFGDYLKSGMGAEFAELTAAFRELPDQKLKDLVKNIRQLSAPAGGSKKSVAVDVPALIARIRASRESPEYSEVIDLDGMKLSNVQLKDILKSFGEKPTTTIAGNLTKVRALLRPNASNLEGAHSTAAPPLDMDAVERGVKLYNALLADRKLSIPDVRAGFDPLRSLPKAVLEEISRRVGYTPVGSLSDILERLLTNLEGIKLSQHRADRILVGTGS
jgi:hypothetical protein